MNKKYVLPACEMQAADRVTIEEVGICQDVLMERAALAVVSRVLHYKPEYVLCVCGIGNNGGDALAVARILLMQGIRADVFLCGAVEKQKLSVKKQYDIFVKVGGKTITTLDFTEYDMIVDGIFGVGLTRNVEGEFAEAVGAINNAFDSGIRVIAADIPSGIHTDTGAVMGTAVKATETVAFAYYKPGHLLYPGAEYCGKVLVGDIGINTQFVSGMHANYFTADADSRIILKERPRNGNKGTFGRVLVIAGSASMYGACYLSALAALRTGAGLVNVFTHEMNRTAIQTMLPEAILHTYYADTGGMLYMGCTNESAEPSKEIKDELCKLVNASDCIVIGPGLSTDDTACFLTKYVLKHCDKTIVADADALNCIAKENDLKELLKLQKKGNVIITPHPGELSRLTGKTIAELKKDYIETVKSFAREYGCIVVGKDAGTLVSDGEYVYINQTGNCGMATAGSGDVLSGIIGALCAQKEAPFDAAWKGVFLHGKAGDKALERSNAYSLIAGDIAGALAEVIKE